MNKMLIYAPCTDGSRRHIDQGLLCWGADSRGHAGVTSDSRVRKECAGVIRDAVSAPALSTNGDIDVSLQHGRQRRLCFVTCGATVSLNGVEELINASICRSL